jgi:hypothetical protein
MGGKVGRMRSSRCLSPILRLTFCRFRTLVNRFHASEGSIHTPKSGSPVNFVLFLLVPQADSGILP